MPGFGALAYDPMTGLAITPEEPDPRAPVVVTPQGPFSKAVNRLAGTQFGEPRMQTWPEKLVRSAATLPGDVVSGEQPMLPPGLRREDYTDAALPARGSAEGVFGNTLFTPQPWQPNDPAMERAQDLAGMAGGGMMFGRLGGPATATVGRDARVLGRKVGSGEPFQHQLIDQPTAVAPPYIPLGPADRMQRPIEAKIDSDLGLAANDRGLTSVARTGSLLADSAVPGAPIAALEGAALDWTPGGGSKTVTLGKTTVDYGISKDGKSGEVILVKTPRNERGQGAARAAMEQMIGEADNHGTTLFLNADPMGKGVSKSRLEGFYKSLGFVKNTGRNKDFTSRAGFVRQPKRLLEDAAAAGAPVAAIEQHAGHHPAIQQAFIDEMGPQAGQSAYEEYLAAHGGQ